jgi:sRNA-binding protein
MNPEPSSAAGSEAPHEAPAAASPATPMGATAGATPAPPGDATSAGAPDTVPDALGEVPAEQQPDASPAESSPAADYQAPAAAPELSPAGNQAKTPELSPAACGARLAELFPALFVAPGAPGAPGPAKPIKLRIHADIQARMPSVFTKRALGIFFSRYTTSNAYLKALSTAPHRFDLDGQPAGEIAAEHRQAATDELARRHALAAERRGAQRPPPRREVPAAEGAPMDEARRQARPDRRGTRPDARHPLGPAAHPQLDGGQRPERVGGTPPSPRTARPQRPPRPADRLAHGAPPERPPQMQGVAAPTALPVDPAQRERAMLLRSFESSPLSKANFCALKGMTEAALDATLALAQAEHGAPSNAVAHRGGGGRRQ